MEKNEPFETRIHNITPEPGRERAPHHKPMNEHYDRKPEPVPVGHKRDNDR